MSNAVIIYTAHLHDSFSSSLTRRYRWLLSSPKFLPINLLSTLDGRDRFCLEKDGDGEKKIVGYVETE